MEPNISLDSFPNLGLYKDTVGQRIEGKADCAAAVVHKLLRSANSDQIHLEFVNDILDMVTLLGEVKTLKHSSMFSAYLREDQMLVVVCKSRGAAKPLERYQIDANVNCASPFEILAAKLGISINGR